MDQTVDGFGTRPDDAVMFREPDDAESADAPPQEPPPPEPPAFPPRRSTYWVALIAIAVLAIIVWQVVSRNRPDVAPATSTPTASDTETPAPEWAGPYETAIANSKAGGPPLGDVVMITPLIPPPILTPSTTPYNVAAFDLATHTVTLRLSPYEELYPLGDTSGLVVDINDQIMVFNPVTGQLISQGDLPSNDSGPIWAGQGMILIYDGTHQRYCRSTMAAPTTCVWQSSASLESSPVFGDGKWVNTADGVIDMVTGQPAPFGQAHQMQQPTGGDNAAEVYYVGDSRIFQVYKHYTNIGITTTYQPWDIMTDSPVSPPVEASTIIADASSPVYIAVTNWDGKGNYAADTTTAYSWQTGAMLWTKQTETAAEDYAQFFNGYFITDVVGVGVPSPGWGYPPVALDVNTGEAAWQPAGQATFVGLSGATIYLRVPPTSTFDTGTLVGYDTAHDFFPALASVLPGPPGSTCSPYIAGTFAFCLTSDGAIYIRQT